MNVCSSIVPVSIVIATYNRWLDLRTTLEALEAGEPIRETIIVDNGSTDGTEHQVKTRFPHVRVIRIEKNLGVPSFGVGLRHATQPFVFLLDDDAIPVPGTIRRSVRCLEESPSTAIVACHILDQKGTAVTDGWPEHPLMFWGCGACVRRSVVDAEPYLFDPGLLLHGTEMDLAIRLYARGLCVKYLPEAVVVHRFSLAGRSESRRLKSLTASAVRFALKHLPVRYAVPALSRHLGLLEWRALKMGCPFVFWIGLGQALTELPSVLSHRRPVPRAVARTYFQQVFEYEPLPDRLLRHLVGWPPDRRSRMVGFGEIVTRLGDE